MSTLSEFMIVAGKDNGQIILNSVENGPLVWPTVALENRTVRPKTYEELSDKENFQADCDLKDSNIVLQGLPPDVYALVNNHKVSKDIWDRVNVTPCHRQKHGMRRNDQS
ncbi:hypothetical protein Tco_0624479 [Tanacetum coccineum]|uniref:Integrase, catalytic region, zinc finger, CCHC-type, peptidase aspartic, catalytic n=1 Tax=Tanacetum coccineum TaxID=301880 RepID=A0ABQ4WE50_9ASTR